MADTDSSPPAEPVPPRSHWLRSEDVFAVLLGCLIIGLSLGVIGKLDLLGWAVATKEWVDPAKVIAPASKNFADLGGLGSLGVTFAFLLVTLTAGSWFIGGNPKRFAAGFTVLFFLAFGCWILGNHGWIAATPDKRKALGLEWSVGLTGEAGYLLALIGGLLIANFIPRFAGWLSEAARSELFVKTAIVIYGAGLGFKAAEASDRTYALLFRGLAAIIEAYLIYWAVVYFVARKYFKFSREWAAPLASGISICGVSAAITTGAAIRARPVVPVMVSSLVVVFSVIEMLLLPWAARTFLSDQPMVAAAWMGLAVKTDGAAIASGEITQAFVYAKAAEGGVVYKPGEMAMTTTTVKVFIDLFIGVWAVILGAIWSWKIDKTQGKKLPFADIWQRFPKFVIGYALTFGIFMFIGMKRPELLKELKSGTDQTDVFRKLFFVLTFFAIGLHANFRKLWAEGLGRLALVYVVSLFGFIIWVGLGISWLFFHDVMPMTVGGAK
ncbi:putative sulfate exporter family transporter [Zavarzinella formosa]|uniref:putative sulfate exporter family transporter n=1 Tax=Zavarzinella formosa TaxID=360055 RepID=UPI0003033F17